MWPREDFERCAEEFRAQLGAFWARGVHVEGASPGADLRGALSVRVEPGEDGAPSLRLLAIWGEPGRPCVAAHADVGAEELQAHTEEIDLQVTSAVEFGAYLRAALQHEAMAVIQSDEDREGAKVSLDYASLRLRGHLRLQMIPEPVHPAVAGALLAMASPAVPGSTASMSSQWAVPSQSQDSGPVSGPVEGSASAASTASAASLPASLPASLEEPQPAKRAPAPARKRGRTTFDPDGRPKKPRRKGISIKRA